MIKINLIYAASINNVIGQGGGIPWKLPPDMKRFRELTEGDTVIMGRKTYESLPEAVRPLPKRQNIVITTDLNYKVPEDVVVYNDLNSAVGFFKELKEFESDNFKEKHTYWVIGGKDILQAFSEIADMIYITRVYQTIDASLPDTVFGPYFIFGKWESVSQDRPLTYRWTEESKDGPVPKRLTYQFQLFKRKG